MAKKFATGNSGRILRDLEMSELREQNIILERQGDREEERFYENRIYQIKLQMAQTTDEQQLFRLETLLEQEVRALEEVKENNRQNEKLRKMMYFIPIIAVFLVFVVTALFILLTPSTKTNKSNETNIKNSSTVTSSTSSSSTIKSSLGGKKTSPTVSSNSTPTASRVSIGDYIGRKYTDVVAELKEKKVPENLIKMEEEESSESEPGTIIRQTPASGTTYDLTKATTITLTVAKKVTSVMMPSYISSSLEFTKNNLIQIIGVKEANIEVVEVSTAPEGTAEGTVVNQTPKPGEKVDLNKTRIKISIYKPKPIPSTSSSSSRSR